MRITDEDRPWKLMALARVALGAVIGAFVAGILALAWGDTRYARRAELDNHANQQDRAGLVTRSEFDSHLKQDRAEFEALKEEVRLHESLQSHPGTAAMVGQVQAQLASIQADLSWIKASLATRARP